MNFFGHAYVATWLGPSPNLGLGSMLPDFTGMIGARQPEVADADVAAGVDLHHLTDRIFHRLPGFVRAIERAEDLLESVGLSRGPRRGAAHVAIELALDGYLVVRPGAAQAYLGALDAATSLEPDVLTWPAATSHERFAALIDRLRDYGTSGMDDPDRLTMRVERALSARPLLALSSEETAALCRAMPSVQAIARLFANDIEDGLRAGIREHHQC